MKRREGKQEEPKGGGWGGGEEWQPKEKERAEGERGESRTR